jgi:hypothetical protein
MFKNGQRIPLLYAQNDFFLSGIILLQIYSAGRMEFEGRDLA